MYAEGQRSFKFILYPDCFWFHETGRTPSEKHRGDALDPGEEERVLQLGDEARPHPPLVHGRPLPPLAVAARLGNVLVEVAVGAPLAAERPVEVDGALKRRLSGLRAAGVITGHRAEALEESDFSTGFEHDCGHSGESS